MPVVTMPDGQDVEFPDDMPREKIQQLIATKFPDAIHPADTQPPAPEPAPAPEKKKGILARTAGDFVRGAKRIAAGDVSLGEVGALAETAVRSATAPIGGDYVAAGAENIVRGVTGQGINPRALAEQRARRVAGAKEAPLLAGAAEAASLVAGGANLVARAPGLAVRTGAKGFGAKAANAGRVGAEAAVVGGVSELAKTGDVGQAAKVAGTSAIIAPAAGKALTAAGGAVSKTPAYIKSIVGEPSQAAIGIIAKRVNSTPNAIRSALENFRATTGRNPSMAEMLDPASVSKFVDVAQNREAAAEVFRQASEDAIRSRPRTLAASILGREQPVSATDVERATNAGMDAVMNNIGEHTVPYAAIRDIVETPGATRRLGADLNAIITRARTNDDLTMREADAIRQAYGKLAKSTTFDAITKSNFQKVRDLFGERIATTSDAYREALNNFTLGMRRVEGVEVGQSAAGKTVRDVQATVNQPASGGASFGTLDPATAAARAGARQEGISQGRISDLAGRAEESAAGAVRVADELRQPGAVDRTAATVSPQRAEQLRELGELETQSATNLNSLDIRRATMQNPSAEVRNAISLIPVIRGRASAGFEAGLIGQGVKYLKKLGIPPNAAERMARDLTSGDPARIETMLKNIERLGVRDDAILELATQMAATQTGAKVSKSDTDQAVAGLVANGYTEAAAKRLVGETNRAISGQ